MAKAIHNKIISLFLEIWKQVLSRFMINKMILSTGPHSNVNTSNWKIGLKSY